MKILKTIGLYIICCQTLFSNAQNKDKSKIKEIFTQTESAYKKMNSGSLNIHFKMYESETSTNIFEKYDGYHLKNGKMSYTKIGQTEFINLSDKTIKIDNQNKKIKINKGLNDNDSANTSINLMPYLNFANKFKLESNNSQWICTLEMGDVSFVPYKKLIIYIDKISNQIIKQQLFFFSKYKIKKKNNKTEYDYPRLEIEYDEFKKENSPDTTLFKSENYIQSKSGNYTPSNKYKDYTIVK